MTERNRPLTTNTIDDILMKYVPQHELTEINRILYGHHSDKRHLGSERPAHFDIEKYRFEATNEKNASLRPRIVKIAAIQHSIVRPTTDPVATQRAHIFAKVQKMIEAASELGANIVCLPETWNMPFGFCTRDMMPWTEFAEDCENGPSTVFVKQLAQRHGMVIISPILERDRDHDDILWNTAVVCSERGEVLGKQRKNHIPPANGETTYYKHGSTGQHVFDTTFGRIGISICFDRHHPHNWMVYAMKGAEIVFNPSATVNFGPFPIGKTEMLQTVNEDWWHIEARSAAISHSYYTVALNRIGVERFQSESKGGEKIVGPFFGSSYITAPDGSRTKSLSRDRDGILYAELDLNMCQLVKEQCGFDQSQRWPEYIENFGRAAHAAYEPQIIRSD